ncbi:hypothetical protein AAHA92_32639 [Salvia divinorum]|uniref:Uncharacterized protein n=1 Tax=Salvia divinorum TaxID=28513 RepID=A0ABD1FLD7_SALDI
MISQQPIAGLLYLVKAFLILKDYTQGNLMHLMSEMRAEADRVAQERKELKEQMQEVEAQLEWVRSEREDEITKLRTEKKKREELKQYIIHHLDHEEILRNAPLYGAVLEALSMKELETISLIHEEAKG